MRIVPILLALMMPLAASANEPAAASEARAPLAPSVTVEAAAVTEVQARVPVSGSIVARQLVQVFPQVSGHEITDILAEAGDSVAKGQVLARLSTDTLAAQLEQARAEYLRAEAGVGQAQSTIDSAAALLTQARTTLERVRQLRQGGTVSQSALDDAVAAEANARAQAASAADGLAVARAALAQAEAARRIAQLDLDRAAIIAPVAGVVVTRNAELGALAGGGGDPLFVLLADGAVEMSAEVIETALGRLKVGDPAEITVAGAGAVPGRVRLVPAAVDPVTRLGVMRISLDRGEGIRIGQFASGWVVTDRRQAVTVPAGAVLADDSGERVQVVKDGTVDTRPVRAGLLWDGRREIVEGLAPGEPVIARSGAFFRTGDQVRPVAASGAGP
ncbi:efflux RND transporter periplasmic adaptor subunit [Paracoccus sp. YIM 132242]|uniref:Efflux RND transporter periplasmic adaptor subunit n=1 Tax=Paracoccus lichenicola TaxID=2665644 RepID=A0A6L6HR82_9RHOB|nr:efflux RND transporter periplasmic adaptor subunit [Paracoccus lichenicola]MTE00861.1 efflux RND transporter periplasmic adaptor subunit [Paracoccus lichenicola]